MTSFMEFMRRQRKGTGRQLGLQFGLQRRPARETGKGSSEWKGIPGWSSIAVDISLRSIKPIILRPTYTYKSYWN